MMFNYKASSMKSIGIYRWSQMDNSIFVQKVFNIFQVEGTK